MPVSLSRHALVVLLLAAPLLVGCTTASGLPQAPRNVAPVTPIADKLPPYQIQVGDIVDIKMALNPEFDQELIVRPDGNISTVLAQDVAVYGRTPAEVQDELTMRYSKQLRNPQITVGVKSFMPNRVYVLGEVNSPGEFVSVGPNLTLMQALARAGGLKLTAQTSKMIIIRRGSGEQPVAYAANFDQAASGRDSSADVRLAAYDVVFVPRTGVAEVHKAFNQYVQQFVPLSLGISYNLNTDN